MSEKTYFKNKIFLLSIFVLGNTLIIFPKEIGIETAIYSLLLSLVPTIFIAYNFIKIGEKPYQIHVIFMWLIAGFCILVFVLTARDYISFVDTIRLPKTPRLIISTVFILLSILLGLVKKRILYLFSIFTFIITSIILITVFLFSLNELNFSALKVDEINFKTLIRQTLTFFIHSFGQLIIPAFFFRELAFRQDKKIYIWGLVFGFLLMLIYVLNIMLVLGSSTASAVNYPYATLTSIVSFGRNFSRLDGFTYYVYFYSSLIKCAITVNVFVSSIKKNKRITSIILSIILLVLCNLGCLEEFLKKDSINLGILLFELILPIFLLIYLKIKSRHTQ